MTHEPIPILWKCTWCGARMELPALWDHLKADHGWDRDAHESGSARRVSRYRESVDLPLGMYRWTAEES